MTIDRPAAAPNPHGTQLPESVSAVLPLLVVRDVAAAADFYRAAFGARVGAEGVIAIGATGLQLVQADRARGLLGAESFGGAPVVFALAAADPEATAAHAVAAGAALLRDVPGLGPLVVRDPFLHLWRIDRAAPAA
jgi:PhnB protein